MAKAASPQLLPKPDNKLFNPAPRHHSAVRQRQHDVRKDKKTQLTSQMRDGSGEEHCQTSLSAQNQGNESPDSAALGDQAGT